MIITIDGPSASGKSTVARLVAHKLSLYYISSGLLFRALAYLLITHKQYTLETIADPQSSDVDYFLDPLLFVYQYTQGQEYVFFNNKYITPHLKHGPIDTAASLLSTQPYVRHCLLEYQRMMAQKNSVIVEGRDTGTEVFPYATYSFFLTASLQQRARRWQADQEKRGHTISLKDCLRMLQERDTRDTQRALAPLKIPPRALIIDGTHWSIDQVVSFIIQTCTARGNE